MAVIRQVTPAIGPNRRLSKCGFTGISGVVEAGYGGFLRSFSRTPNPARLIEGLGHDWEAGNVGFKMYPNVTSIHAALDAFRSVLIEECLAATEIGEIHVGCGHMTFVHMAWEYSTRRLGHCYFLDLGPML
jgi:2-methylcitrate dehydratase PrpD